MYCRTGFLWLRLPQKCSQEDQASSLKLSSPTCTKMSANGSKTTSLFLPRWFILPKGTWIKSWSNNPYFDLSYCLFLWNVQQTPGRYPRYPKIQIWTDFLHKKVVEVLGYVPLYVGECLRLFVPERFCCCYIFGAGTASTATCPLDNINTTGGAVKTKGPFQVEDDLPSLKLTAKALKMVVSNWNLIFQMSIFRGFCC